jgi:hypothetical protein
MNFDILVILFIDSSPGHFKGTDVRQYALLTWRTETHYTSGPEGAAGPALSRRPPPSMDDFMCSILHMPLPGQYEESLAAGIMALPSRL